VNEKAGKIFCLCHAPNAEAAIQVHRKAHGMVADKVIEIQPELAEGFLGGVEVNKAGAALVPGATDERDPGIRTILFTDIVESTALTQSMGDEGVMALLDLHNGVVRNALAGLGGREIKHTGDGIMASFVSAAAAVKCATQIQRDLAKHGENQRDRAIKVRIGAAAGEPVEQHHDLFGCTVQLAARLCSHASPDQILVSNAIAELCLGKGFSFQDVGEVALKGFDRPVRAHAVVWAGDAVPAA
jgi:class 3 adenylate cyclase